MALNPHKRRPLKVLAGLAGITVVLLGLLFGANTWGSGQWTPKLGLDLEGGTQMVLEPVLVGTNKVSSEQLNQARDIIVQRVDANGVAGAEVTTRGGRNIVVSMPGQPTKATEEAIRKSSQMRFRPVIVAGAGMPQPTPTTTPSGTATGKPTGSATPSKAPVPTATGATTTAAKSGLPQALLGSTTAPTPAATTAAATSKPAATATASPTSAAPAGKPANASDPKWITEDIAARFKALECTPGAADKIVDDPAKPLVTCSDDGLEKFILGPVEVRGDEIKDAVAGYQPLSNGQPSSTVEIQLSFNGSGTKHFADVTKRLVSLPEPRNRFAVTLDSKVLTAPTAQAAILNGQASITGGFTIESARDLANQLKFGALPMSFTLQTRENISPTLGGEQLRFGLVAGMIGLLLVVVYSLFQYRALGFVTVASLVVAGGLTYLSLTILGWSHDYRLDMAGVTGLIDRHRRHSRLVHRLLRTRPRRGPRGPRAPASRRHGLEAGAAHDPRRRRGELHGRHRAVLPGLLERARLRLHPRPDDAHRHPGRLLLHPPAHGPAGGDQVLRWRPQVVRAQTRSDWAPRPRRATPDGAGFDRRAGRCNRGECPMINFSRFGNDLYTGKRSIDFVEHRRRWYALSAVLVVLALLGLATQKLNFGLEFTRWLGVPRLGREQHRELRVPGARRRRAGGAGPGRERHQARHEQQHDPRADREAQRRPERRAADALAKAFGVDRARSAPRSSGPPGASRSASRRCRR